MLIIACNTMAAVASHVVKDKAGRIPVLDVIDAVPALQWLSPAPGQSA
jgi:glutamate racemase